MNKLIKIATCTFGISAMLASCALQRTEQNVEPNVVAPVATSGNTQASLSAKDMLTLVNNIRAKGCNCGTTKMPAVNPLTLNEKLNAAANVQALDMANNSFFSHTGSDGSQPWDRVTKVGYQWSSVGENIAAGYATGDATMNGWIASADIAKI